MFLLQVVQEVEIGVRYDVDCSTEHPVSHGVRVLVKVLYDTELRRPLYYFTVPVMVVRTTGPGKGLNIMNAKYQGYDHGS